LFGGIWGVTAVAALGLTAWELGLGYIGWHFLSGIVLLPSLLVVKKVAERNPDPTSASDPRNCEVDGRVSMAGFAVGYILVWLGLWSSVNYVFSSVVI